MFSEAEKLYSLIQPLSRKLGLSGGLGLDTTNLVLVAGQFAGGVHDINGTNGPLDLDLRFSGLLAGDELVALGAQLTELGYFSYLKGNVLPMTRLAYLHDVTFFMNYLIDETDLTKADKAKEISRRQIGRASCRERV